MQPTVQHRVGLTENVEVGFSSARASFPQMCKLRQPVAADVLRVPCSSHRSQRLPPRRRSLIFRFVSTHFLFLQLITSGFHRMMLV